VNARRVALLREVLARQGSAWITCAGGSMEPTIPRGARLMVVPWPREARAGDVLLLDTPRAPVAHRILLRIPAPPWSKAGAFLVHAGDAGRFGGGAGLIRERQVLGKIVGVAGYAPLGRRLLATIRAFSRAGFPR
jgi:hypothetical protein